MMNDMLSLLLTTNTINFLIVVALLLFLCKKLGVIRKLDELKAEIKEYINSSEKEKENSLKLLSEAEDAVKRLPSEIESINRDADSNIRHLEEKSAEDTEKEKKVISDNAERLLNLEIKNFKQKLTEILSLESIKSAKENLVNNLDNNRELHDKYIEDAIIEIDGMKL